MSPHPFICCVEALIQMVNSIVGEHRLSGIFIAPTAPIISHLCFADDTILFCQATKMEAEAVIRLLSLYPAASGQIINMDKSTMVYSPNTPKATRDVILRWLPFQVVPKFEKYLGLPAHIYRLFQTRGFQLF